VRGLRIRAVTKAFGPQQVLRGVDLTVPEGSFSAILGASGSGKTTLLRIVAGFERPDQGEVRLGEEVVDDGSQRFVPCERRRIGYVPQEGALFPHLSVGRNIGFGLPRGQHRRERVVALLELTGLRGLGRRYPHQLSGGQQQRVALARALAIEPEIVLLDEPFSSLDAAMRASVRSDVLGVLRRAGTTSILVTHDQDEALSMADHVAILRRGVIAQVDTPAMLYGHPGDAELAGFLGESNILRGEVRDGVATTALGRLALHSWSGLPTGGPAQVLVRPEQIVLSDATAGGPAGAPAGGLEGTVESYEYFGHDAVVRVRPGSADLPELVVRVTGGRPVEPGRRVGLSVQGGVVAWPRTPSWDTEDDGESGRAEATENSRTTPP
jgi:iron(III) transport system ATP-binding protein